MGSLFSTTGILRPGRAALRGALDRIGLFSYFSPLMVRSSLLIMTAAAWLLAASALAEPLQIAPQQGLLLLRSGGVLQGKIARSGDHFYVALKDGEIRVKAADVELFAHDLDEAYRLKHAALVGDAAGHLELAGWCLNNNLLGYAAREILSAREANPKHPEIPLLERRLQLAVQPVHWPKFGGLPAVHNAPEELDALVSRLPGGTIETYTSTIQPLLVNRCATGGCHGPGSTNRFHLERPAAGRLPTRRVTQRNLQATVRMINLADPAASPLLTQPSGAHGTAREAIFTMHDEHAYEQLARWVEAVTRREQPPQPASVDQTSAPLLQTIAPRGAGRQRAPHVTPAGMATNAGPAAAAEAPPSDSQQDDTQQGIAEPAKTTDDKSDDAKDGQRERKRSDDPFDPEIFNRRYGTKR